MNRPRLHAGRGLVPLLCMLAACTGAPELDVSSPHLQAETPRVLTPHGELPEAGQRDPPHAKTAVVDGVLSTVGSTNLDWRSFVYNDELNTTVLGEDFGRATTAMFEADLRDATRIELPRWRDRGAVERVKERTARLFAWWL